MKEWNFPFLWKGFLRSSKRRNFYIHSWPKFSRKTEALARARESARMERGRVFAWPHSCGVVPLRRSRSCRCSARSCRSRPRRHRGCLRRSRSNDCAARAPLGRCTAPPAPCCTAPPSHGLTSTWSHPLGALFLGKDKEREGCWIFYLAPSYSYGG